MASYVADGYSREAYVKASEPNEAGESLHGALSFTFRPATRIDNVRHDAEVKAQLKDEYSPKPDDAVKAELLACKFVASKIVSWDLKDSNDNDIAVTPENCSRLNAALFYKIYSIVRGTGLSDPKPPAEQAGPSDEEQQKN